MNYDVILIRYGELSLKSTYVRKLFETTLIHNIKGALTHANITHGIAKERGRIYLTTDEISKSLSVLNRIFGIVSCSPAIQTITDLDVISEHSLEILKNVLTKQKSFALRVTRVGSHPFTSQEAAVYIGNVIVNATHAPVDLTYPDVELFIEIRQNKTFLFTEKHHGVGGLPLGTQGMILAVIEDPSSLLAAWYLMRRGCNVLMASTNQSHTDSIRSFLSHWFAKSDSIIVDMTTQDSLEKLSGIIMDNECEAIVTGDTLQNTVSALLKINQLKQQFDLPILTPLIAFDEKEIKTQCQSRGIQT
jgi:adenylyl- and sulfurtransferase ThiI